MKPDSPAPIPPQDIRLMRRTLRRLTLSQVLRCVAFALIVTVLWALVLRRLLTFGKELDYSGLQAFGAQTVHWLEQYNPFLWGAIGLLATLLLIYFVYGVMARSKRRAKAKLVNRHVIEQLVQGLSPMGIEVLQWTWQDRRHPITVGLLQHALIEMRTHRAGKIALARQHQELVMQQNSRLAGTASLSPEHENVA